MENSIYNAMRAVRSRTKRKYTEEELKELKHIMYRIKVRKEDKSG